MPEGLRYDQHRPATEQEDEPLEGVIVDVGESPERAPRTLQQSIEFWQRKAAEQIREAHERIARESVQKSVPTLAGGTTARVGTTPGSS
jgi:hypothetical protein